MTTIRPGSSMCFCRLRPRARTMEKGQERPNRRRLVLSCRRVRD
ncbi:unnamed protein product [Amoebophrya sp. A120]|nr:unnamed protein product [Amoebophrya sp. A120]|eukprot:GSA120T00005937001.1